LKCDDCAAVVEKLNGHFDMDPGLDCDSNGYLHSTSCDNTVQTLNEELTQDLECAYDYVSFECTTVVLIDSSFIPTHIMIFWIAAQNRLCCAMDTLFK